jgi:hypothetical protein
LALERDGRPPPFGVSRKLLMPADIIRIGDSTGIFAVGTVSLGMRRKRLANQGVASQEC